MSLLKAKRNVAGIKAFTLSAASYGSDWYRPEIGAPQIDAPQQATCNEQPRKAVYTHHFH